MPEGEVRRILVVEDLPESRRSFGRTLRRANYVVDEAATLQEALERVEARTYHVAVVDLSLEPGRSENRDGIKVLRRLKELNEGTRCVVLTAFKDLDVAVEGYERLGLVRYIVKSRAEGNGGDLPGTVKEVLEGVKIRELGDAPSLSALLCGQHAQVLHWEDAVLRTMRPEDGILGLHRALAAFCGALLPLHPLKEARAPLQLSEAAKSLSGIFWSKALGGSVSIEVRIAREGAASRPDGVAESGAEIIPVRRSAGLECHMTRLTNYSRSAFLDRI